MTEILYSPTRRVTLTLNGQPFSEWTGVEITRDMQDMTGNFSVELRDARRSSAALAMATLASYADLVRVGITAELAIDNETVLVGWVDTVAPSIRDGEARVSISGSDKARDLIDGAATVDGPAELKDKKLDAIITEVVKPYGLKVRAEVDVGEAFPRYMLDAAETALSAVEKGLRQRGVLAMSDGVGSIVLTQTGASRAPAALTLPGNVVAADGEFTIENRHSEYVVKGQAEKAQGKRRKEVPLDSKAEPLAAPAPMAAQETSEEPHEKPGVVIEGRMRDAEMQRHRPLVTLARTQLTDEGAQQQAEWMERTARGSSETITYEVVDWRAGEARRLWRPNEMVPVDDAYMGINRDMLIAGVTFRYREDDGAKTSLRVTSPEAYDTKPVGARRTNHPKPGKTSAPAPALDSTAYPLTVG